MGLVGKAQALPPAKAKARPPKANQARRFISLMFISL